MSISVEAHETNLRRYIDLKENELRILQAEYASGRSVLSEAQKKDFARRFLAIKKEIAAKTVMLQRTQDVMSIIKGGNRTMYESPPRSIVTSRGTPLRPPKSPDVARIRREQAEIARLEDEYDDALTNYYSLKIRLLEVYGYAYNEKMTESERASLEDLRRIKDDLERRIQEKLKMTQTFLDSFATTS